MYHHLLICFFVFFFCTYFVSQLVQTMLSSSVASVFSPQCGHFNFVDSNLMFSSLWKRADFLLTECIFAIVANEAVLWIYVHSFI